MSMLETKTVVVAKQISKQFLTPSGPLSILENVSFAINRGEKIAIIGPSGSGKSTLLSLLGLLDTPSSGAITVTDVNTGILNEQDQANFRNKNIGFIFQSFELISPFTVRENIIAPLEIGGKPVDDEQVNKLISQLGLTSRQEALPYTLSGGEKQRVAIARALITKPAIILADEPTGSLDRATGEKVLSLLLEATAQAETTLLIITHDESIAARMNRVFELKDKTLYERL